MMKGKSLDIDPVTIKDIERYLLSDSNVETAPIRKTMNESSHSTMSPSSSHQAARSTTSIFDNGSYGFGRWGEPPSALQELRESKSKSARRGVQTELGVTPEDIDRVLASVRETIADKRTSFVVRSNKFGRQTDSQRLPASDNSETLIEMPESVCLEESHEATCEQISQHQVYPQCAQSLDVIDNDYGTIIRASNTEIKGCGSSARMMPDSRITKAAIWMGVMFAFVFVASYSMSQNVLKRPVSSSRTGTAQILASAHGAKTPFPISKSLSSTAKIKQMNPIAQHADASKSAKLAASARLHHEFTKIARDSAMHSVKTKSSEHHRADGRDDLTKADIIRDEEKAMAKKVSQENDMFVHALMKGGV